jgi:hypothetical protein
MAARYWEGATASPSLEIQIWPIDLLVLYARNRGKITPSCSDVLQHSRIRIQMSGSRAQRGGGLRAAPCPVRGRDER